MTGKRGAFLCLCLAWPLLAWGGGPEWFIDRGWPCARTGDVAILSPGTGTAAEVTVDDRPFAGSEPVTQRLATGAFETVYRSASGVLTDRLEPFGALGDGAWLRSLAYTNTSGMTQDLTLARMSVLPVAMAGGAAWDPQFIRMVEVAPSQAVCVGYRGTDDYYALESGAGGRVSHILDACWRLAPGQVATIGAQGIWLGAAGREAFRHEARRWFDAIGLRVPPPPEWLLDAVLYETCAGGHIDSRFSDVGGFDRLAGQADYLADLGVNAVWLQSVHDHKAPPDPVRGAWNHYDPRDFSKVDAILGGPDALKRLADQFRQRGIRMLGELVPHGGHSVQARALEPWWTCRRDGMPQRNWGGCGMDYSSPAWQGVMHDAAAALAREFGFEGARIDVADGSGPNWKSPVMNHASASTLAATVRMLAAMRDGFVAGGATAPVIIPENVNTLEHFAVTPVAYGHSCTNLFARDLPLIKDRPEAMAETLRAFFEREQGSYPEGALLLRTLNNHDTVCETGRVQYRYGAGLARALYGVCLVTPGIPMLYQEEELGSHAALRRMNWARRRVPEFGRGTADYAVTFAPGVFGCLRTCGTVAALGLSNLSGETRAGIVHVPVNSGDTAYDAVSERQAEIEDGAFSWTLEPYDTALFRLGTPPVGVTPPERYAGETPSTEGQQSAALSVVEDETGPCLVSGTLRARLCPEGATWKRAGDPGNYASDGGTMRIAKEGDALRISIASRSGTCLACSNADRWYVSGQTALLEDPALRRHYPFPPEAHYRWDRTMPWLMTPLYNGVAPTDRLWQSLLEPLSGENPAVAFEDGTGASLCVRIVRHNAENVVLSDRAEGPDQPYTLALEFYRRDPELNPRVEQLGLGQPWRCDGMTAPPAGAAEIELLVTSAPPRTALAAQRRPIDRGECRFHFEGPRYQRDREGAWFVEPGKAVWSSVAPVAGRYRVRFELRHSEGSPDGEDLQDAYEILMDGAPMPLEWVKHNTFSFANAYFGHALTPPVDLAGTRHEIAIVAKKPWCAVREGFWLVAAD